MKIVNRRYVSDEAADRIDKYIDGLAEGEKEEIGSQIPVSSSINLQRINVITTV